MAEKFDQAAYTAAYNKENYSRIELKVPKETKARWELQAKTEGVSLTALIKKKMEETNRE
jgi:predicted HicB family RNase H-like nuclease